MAAQKVWLITGASTGLGRELAVIALARGDKVIATARSSEAVKDIVESYPNNCRSLQLDVTDSIESLADKAKKAVTMWGRVDVLVNNAGWSLVGFVEESGADGLIEMYKTNVYGAVNVTNAFLPYMRARRSGTIVFVGSRSGWRTRLPALGNIHAMTASNYTEVNLDSIALYGSSKAAIHAIADALSVEVAPLNIRVLNVVPGGLRTPNINNIRYVSNDALAHAVPDLPFGEVPEYSVLRSQVREYLDATNGTQTGDPKKAASVIVDVVRDEGVAKGRAWTHTLFLGSDAVEDVSAKCQETLTILKEWEDVARGVDL